MSGIACCSMKIYLGILCGRSCTHIKWATFRSNQIRYFKVFKLQSEKVFQSYQISQTREGKKDEKLLSKFTNKIEFKRSQSSSKGEVKAERNKAKSSVVETNRTKYTNKLKEGEVPAENKGKDKEMKKFRLKDTISDNDLQIKVNSMLKYVEKGRKIYCEVLSKSDKNNFENFLKKLNNTALKDYYLGSNISETKLCATYEKKATNEESSKVQSKEIDKCS